jgi:hypothetical protein
LFLCLSTLYFPAHLWFQQGFPSAQLWLWSSRLKKYPVMFPCLQSQSKLLREHWRLCQLSPGDLSALSPISLKHIHMALAPLFFSCSFLGLPCTHWHKATASLSIMLLMCPEKSEHCGCIHSSLRTLITISDLSV